ncbi:MAG: hypothetical protein Q9195_002297 [Heterodermia aff. obscurata]
MPTPSDTSDSLQFSTDPRLERPNHPSCPPESDRSWPEEVPPSSPNTALRQQHYNDELGRRATENGTSVARTVATDQSLPIVPSSSEAMSPMHLGSADLPGGSAELKDEEQEFEQFLSPELEREPVYYIDEGTSTNESRFSNTRIISNWTSSFLRPGSKFKGTQQSDRQNYNVEVEIKYVDMAESFLCGYLRIEGLTEDHPTLTTYFEGEIIGPKYTFQTRHPSWGATDKTDMQHWGRFPAWRPLAKQAKKPDFHYKNGAQRENIFMRWKESFLVPDHRVREIMGASFEGFYYICFNQVQGTVSGIYFHAKSEK